MCQVLGQEEGKESWMNENLGLRELPATKSFCNHGQAVLCPPAGPLQPHCQGTDMQPKPAHEFLQH